jgi:hypothetical protein
VNELEIPSALEGNWEHCVILTYGADLPFFENALLRQFHASCRNKLVLADGRQFQEACVSYAEARMVRGLNRQYVAEGIRSHNAAHAKMILLASRNAGRLLVGSGNLSQDGYASGGELFVEYEYGTGDTESLGAFLTAREVLEAVVERGSVGPQARRRIQYLTENVPWVFGAAPSADRPVRHNLDRSFLDQLREALGDEPVSEAWVLSPFFDEGLKALTQFIDVLQPAKVNVLVQRGRTSVDPAELEKVKRRMQGKLHVVPFVAEPESLYVHAKMYLLKSRRRAVCLVGSPNLSQVAFLRSGAQANIEMASILAGDRQAFDSVWDHLSLQPVEHDLHSLGLAYRGDDDRPETDEAGLILLTAAWDEKRMWIRYSGNLPDLGEATLVIGGEPFKTKIAEVDGDSVEVVLAAEAVEILDEYNAAVSVRWQNNGTVVETNPVYPADLASLEAALRAETREATLAYAGSLDLEDAELEELFEALKESLILDRESVWRLAGRSYETDESDEADGDPAPTISYEQLDYEAIRNHPKIQQYLRRASGGGAAAPTRLQIILRAILGHFDGMVPPGAARLPTGVGTTTSAVEPVDADEAGQQAALEEWERRRVSASKRLRRVVKDFIRRYLRGIRSPDFQQFAGCEVMTANYVIFTHILWRLCQRAAEDSEFLNFLYESLYRTWAMFWGQAGSNGYWSRLGDADRQASSKLVRDNRSDALMLASLYTYERFVAEDGYDETTFLIRDLARGLLASAPFALSKDVLVDVWLALGSVLGYRSPTPGEIVSGLDRLASYSSEESFLQEVGGAAGVGPEGCHFEQTQVMIPHLRRSDGARCLILARGDPLASAAKATELLQRWMQVSRMDYYRIQYPSTAKGLRGIFYDRVTREGTYWANDLGSEPMEFGELPPAERPWGYCIGRSQVVAKDLEKELSVLVRAEPGASG